MKNEAKKGDWVEIHKLILRPEERAPQVPDETKKVPLEMRVKGWLEQDQATVGAEVTIRTAIGRSLSGRLRSINPEFMHTFGRPVPELLSIGPELRLLLGSSEEERK